jgi:hypothetical protein
MTEINPYASPQGGQAIDPLLMEGGGVWRDGMRLVMDKRATLPGRCIKCNAPVAGKRLRRSLSWHSPWLYILILVSIWVYVIVALCVRQTAKIDVAICERHRQKRGRSIMCGWLVFIVSAGLFFAGIQFENPWLIIVAMVLFLSSLILAVIVSRLVIATLIDKEYVWLKGVCPEFLAELPLWLPLR